MFFLCQEEQLSSNQRGPCELYLGSPLNEESKWAGVAQWYISKTWFHSSVKVPLMSHCGSSQTLLSECHVAAVVSNSVQHYGLQPASLLCPWNYPGRILEWVAISFSRGSSWPRDWTWASYIYLHWQADSLLLCATWEPCSVRWCKKHSPFFCLIDFFQSAISSIHSSLLLGMNTASQVKTFNCAWAGDGRVKSHKIGLA